MAKEMASALRNDRTAGKQEKRAQSKRIFDVLFVDVL